MATEFVFDKKFENIDYSSEKFEQLEYENCVFSSCNFYEVNISNSIFDNCTFNFCNLSKAIADKTAFRKVYFNDCKIIGTQLQFCKPFGLEAHFKNCELINIDFTNMIFKNTIFKLCNLQQADFTDADFEGSIFEECNLAAAIFENTILEKCDFTTAVHFSIDPERNKIKKAKFSTNKLGGLLDKYKIVIEE